jgi:hypothetical protein
MKTRTKFACGLMVVIVLIIGSCGKKKSTEPTSTPTSSLSFSSIPATDPSGLVVDQDTSVIVRVGIAPNPKLIQSSVRLLKVNSQNQVIDSLNFLYDDGDLNHGDDISGDGVFSTKQHFHESSEGTISLKVMAITQETKGNAVAYTSVFTIPVVANISDQAFNATLGVQDQGSNKYDSLKALVGETLAKQQTLTWVSAQSGVTSAALTEEGDAIEVEYDSGIKGLILLYPEGSRGSSSGQNRQIHPQIPPSLQTRGTLDLTTLPRPAYAEVDEDTVGSTTVLIYDAFYTDFSPADEGDLLWDIFVDSDCPKFNVIRLKDAECTVEMVKNFDDYGVVYLITHGGVSGGQVNFLTGQQATVQNKTAHIVDLNLGRIGLATVKGKNYYSIFPSFITNYTGTYPKSVIFSASCYSGANQTMSNAFINKGVLTYLGYTKSVSSSFCVANAPPFFQKMVNEGKKTGEAFVPGQIDPNLPHAQWVMSGSANARYVSNFVNGGFESGSLQGWSRDGDGRVITQLVFLEPQEGNYMAIISTGLGFTTESGSISQSFCIPEGKTTLSFSYNFLSEEFMEWVNSQYQDYFQVSIATNTNSTTLLYKNINGLSTEVDSVDNIDFDQGDVWMTGWRTVSLDISAYAGKGVTLTFKCGDVGDSIYDTAVLIDDIKVQ